MHWFYLSTVALTHACLMLPALFAGIWVQPSRRRPAALLATLAEALAHVAVIALFITENFVCGVGWSRWGLAGEPPHTCGELTAFKAVHGGPDGAPLLKALGMTTVWELVSAVYVLLSGLLLLRLGTPALLGFARWPWLPYLGSGRDVACRLVTTACYSAFWLLVIGVKWAFEYYFVIEPMVQPSRALWYFAAHSARTDEGPADFFCWDYNWIPGRSCSYTAQVGGAERGFGDAFPELGFSEETSSAYLFGLRTLRSYYFRIMLLLLRWATPTLLVFADTAILYSLVASLFSFMLAHHRGVYHAHSWSATVRNLAVSVTQFNTKVLAPRGVAMLTHEPLWYLQEGSNPSPTPNPQLNPSLTRYLQEGVQREEASLEACSTQWCAFATAWNCHPTPYPYTYPTPTPNVDSYPYP